MCVFAFILLMLCECVGIIARVCVCVVVCARVSFNVPVNVYECMRVCVYACA